MAFEEAAEQGLIDRPVEFVLHAENGLPNGSARNIAGIFNDTKNVLGLMPHPENAIEPVQGSTDGKALFKGIVEALS